MKNVLKGLVFGVSVMILCLMSVPATSSTTSAKESGDVQVYSSVIWPEYAKNSYYTIMVDSVGRKATFEYTFITTPYEEFGEFVFVDLSGNYVVKNGSSVITRGIGIRQDSFNSKETNENNKITLEYDFSEKKIKEYKKKVVPEGSNGYVEEYELSVSVDEGIIDPDYPDDLYGTVGTFSIKNGKLLFKEDEHQHEEKVIDHLTKNYKPGDFSYITSKDYSSYNRDGFLDTLQEKVKEITEGCNSDVEKYFAIHDWICNNISYDYKARDIIRGMSKPLNKSELIDIATNPEKVYKYKRAVSEGYSALGELMLKAAEIPVVNIDGMAEYFDHFNTSLKSLYYIYSDEYLHTLSESRLYRWNAVYINGKWRFADFRWDSGGKYYGDNSEKNIDPFILGSKWSNCTESVFGKRHISFFGPDGRLAHTIQNPKTDNVPKIKAGKIKKATSLKNGISLSWNKISNIKGYEIQCSTNKKFTSIDRVINMSSLKSSVKITKLKKKTTYYVRIRAYIGDDSEKWSGPWSAIKKIKTK